MNGSDMIQQTGMNIQKKPRSDTRNRILDAAEHLFALKGFQRTTIKHLACEAGVNQAAANYYFGSKAALIEKVIERRLGPINQQRMQRLAAVQETAARKGCRPLAKEALRAYIEPPFTMGTHLKGKRFFLALMSRAFSEPDATIKSIIFHQLKPPLMLLFQIMKTALPGLPDDVLSQRLHFTVGAMAHCMRLSSGSFSSSDFFPPVADFKTTPNQLLDFVTSGVCAPYSPEEGQ